jgi:anoctamin-10
MYFAFMEVYARWLVVPAVLGAGIYIRNLVRGTATNIITTPLYGLTICLWATLFLEFWRRKESSWSRRWGQHNFLTTEASRPDYHGDWVVSPVDGREQERFASWKKLLRQLVTHSGYSSSH